MINLNNYLQEVERLGLHTFPEGLKKGHEYFITTTDNGTFYDDYEESEKIKATIDLYLEKLNEFAAKRKETPVIESTRKGSKPAKAAKPKEVKQKKSSSGKSKPPDSPKSSAKKVEHIREEVKFIKRYVSLHNKVKSPNAILAFIKALQRSIVQKLIRKTSPLAAKIEMIQDKLINAYNKMKGDEPFKINEGDLKEFVNIAGGEEVYPSINIIKRYVGLQGKVLESDKYERFSKQITKALESKKVAETDPYYDKVKAILNTLKKLSDGKQVSIAKAELNGLEGILKSCGCKNDVGRIHNNIYKKHGSPHSAKTNFGSHKRSRSPHHGLSGVLSAEEMGNRQFDTLDFTYPWDTLMGKPAKNFNIMFHGDPGSGKTTLLLKFAESLAINFGKVIYISSEEHDASTLTDKINELLPTKPDNLHFAPDIESADLSQYDFVILDSVNDLGLKLEDFKQLKKENSHAAFILILQHTKDGGYRGGKDWEHDTQIAAKVENGLVTVYRNRYGVKGTLNFFKHFNTKPIQSSSRQYPDDHSNYDLM
jgi:hypothetical protein